MADRAGWAAKIGQNRANGCEFGSSYGLAGLVQVGHVLQEELMIRGRSLPPGARNP